MVGKALNIVPDKGPRKYATAAAFIWVGEYLWTLDWKVFTWPRLRVDIWACLSLAAYTSARVSDYIESSARVEVRSVSTTRCVCRYETAPGITWLMRRSGYYSNSFPK